MTQSHLSPHEISELAADCIENCEVILSRTSEILESELYTLQTLDSVLQSSQPAISVVEAIIQLHRYNGVPLLPQTLEALEYFRQNLLDAEAVVMDLQLILGSDASRLCSPILNNLSRMVEDSGCVGRPRTLINNDLVELLQSAGYTWVEIAECLQVSRSSLWRHVQSTGLPNIPRYSGISDWELADIISQIQQYHPCTGRSLTQGYLLGMGVRVQRWRVADALHQVNPITSTMRWQQTISRRRYSVPGPNSLWHIDGHHSLIRWRFVIHGGIDGYSRYIVFLQCSTNNRAETMFQAFLRATQSCGVPSRVRSDRGGENILVCSFMISTRGPDRGCHIAGSSHHNQRIERLWRDVYRCVAATFHSIFCFMEANGILDPDNELDLFVLHCVYLARINEHLQVFTSAWNNHSVRTEHNWTPRRMWINGMLDPQRQDLTAVRDSMPDTEFGVDYYGPLPAVVEAVEVIETPIPLNDLQMQEYVDIISCMHTNNFWIDVFVEARQLLNTLLIQASTDNA